MFGFGKFRKSSDKLKTLDLILLVIGIFLGLFIVAMIVLFICFQSVPDVLIQCVCGSSSIELIITAWITIQKRKSGVNDDNI